MSGLAEGSSKLELSRLTSAGNVRGGGLWGSGERRDRDAETGGRLQFHALHPEDAATGLNNGPKRAGGAGNAQTLQHFLDLAGAGGVAEGDAVAGTPVAEGCCAGLLGRGGGR